MGGMCDCISKEPLATKVESNETMGGSDTHCLKVCMLKVAKKDDIVKFGLNMFADMFVLYPYTREWFPNFRTNPNEIYSDSDMKAHVATVLQAIQVYVNYSNDHDTLRGLVEKMALVHLAHCVTSVDMEVFWRCFMRQMKISMGGHLTARRRQAWNKFMAMHSKTYKRLEDDWLQGKILPPHTVTTAVKFAPKSFSVL